MKRSRFTEEQIISILREQEAGAKTVDVCQRHGIRSATFYAWKAKFGDIDVLEAKRLKALKDESAKLKRLLAEANRPRQQNEFTSNAILLWAKQTGVKWALHRAGSPHTERHLRGIQRPKEGRTSQRDLVPRP